MNTQTTVATAANFSDIVSQLEAASAAYQQISTSSWKPGLKAEGFAKNVKEETDVKVLLHMWSSIYGRNKNYEAAMVDIARDSYPALLIDGGTVDDWKYNIQLRIKILEQKETLDTLEELRKEASQFITDAEKKESFMKKLAAFSADKMPDLQAQLQLPAAK